MKGPLKLKWKQGRDMPYRMSTTIQAIVIGDNVYIGGGYTLISLVNCCTVMVYSLASGSWSKLPPHETQWFGMAAVNNELVLVGGLVSTKAVTGILAMWDEGSRTWTRPFPEMPTPRHSSSVISYQKWLVVAGGQIRRESFSYSNKVEILDTLSRQWYEGPPIPSGCKDMSSAINGNMWYLSSGLDSQGNNEHVFCVCLDELISQALSQSAGNTSPPQPSPWQTLTDTLPTQVYSTLLVLNGALLTVGGIESSAIHRYQPSSRSWVKVGDLPTKRWQCACTVLPNGEIFVVGGYTKRELLAWHVHVDLGVLI